MARLDLAWGDGSFSILLDLRNMQILAYSSEQSAAEVHRKFGGKNYYRSCSGMSGEGWIPWNPALRAVSTYRVDSAYIDAPRLEQGQETVPGLGLVIVPIDYRQGTVPSNWPIVVMQGYHHPYYEGDSQRYNKLYMLDQWDFSRLLKGDEDGLEEIEVTVKYVPSISAEPVERVFPVCIRKGVHLNYRRALVGLFNNEIAFDSGISENTANRFWSRLGIRRYGDQYCKVAQNVCWDRFGREEISTMEGLQAAAPASVVVISPNLYIQEAGIFEAVGLFQVNGFEVEFEERLDSIEAIRIMGGEYTQILQRLEAGARRKVEQDRAYSLRLEEERMGREKFLELCEEHGEVVVTIDDSLASGNCRPGTERFLAQNFPGRDSVTVGELMAHLQEYGVKRVLEYKLLQL